MRTIFFRAFASAVKRATTPTEQLNDMYKLSLAVNNTSSTLEKYALLKQHPNCHSLLKRIYDPHLRHFNTSKAVLNYIESKSISVHANSNNIPQFQSVEALLDALSSRTITGYEAYDAIASFYFVFCKTEAHKTIFWRILDRNLKMGASVFTIRNLLSAENKEKQNRTENDDDDDAVVAEGEAKQNASNKKEKFSVALASSFHQIRKRSPFDVGEAWHASQKLDGIRCIAMIRKDQDIQFYSRTGRPFYSLQKVKNDLSKLLKDRDNGDKEFVLDGEIVVYNQGAKNEDFLKAVSQVRRINEEMENPVYQVFDRVCLEAFWGTKGKTTFSKRQQLLKSFIGENEFPHLKMVEQVKLESMEQLESMKEKALQNGWEGLILRKDVPYEGKRTRNMLKLKEWDDAEYTVKSIETGLMRMADTGEERMVMTNVYIEHKNNTVSVGSGFSIQNRIEFAKDPSLIIGKTITVRYFSESFKENGDVSLRFPSIKAIYPDGKRDV